MDTSIVDLSKSDLEMFLKPHELKLMRIVWDADGPMDSRTACKLLGGVRSRATVINFLHGAADRGWLEMTQKGVKGGIKSLYLPSKDFPCEASFTQELAMNVMKAMGDLLGVTFMVKQRRVSEESG